MTPNISIVILAGRQLDGIVITIGSLTTEVSIL
jgi:hypothetical protein